MAQHYNPKPEAVHPEPERLKKLNFPVELSNPERTAEMLAKFFGMSPVACFKQGCCGRFQDMGLRVVQGAWFRSRRSSVSGA